MRRDEGGRVCGGERLGRHHDECRSPRRHWRLCNGSMAHSRISLVISERTSGSVDRLKLGRLSDRQLHPENSDTQDPLFKH